MIDTHMIFWAHFEYYGYEATVLLFRVQQNIGEESNFSAMRQKLNSPKSHRSRYSLHPIHFVNIFININFCYILSLIKRKAPYFTVKYAVVLSYFSLIFTPFIIVRFNVRTVT